MSISAPSTNHQDSCIALQGELDHSAPVEAYASFIGIPVVVNHLAWIAIIIIHHWRIGLPSTYPSTTGVVVWSTKICCSIDWSYQQGSKHLDTTPPHQGELVQVNWPWFLGIVSFSPAPSPRSGYYCICTTSLCAIHQKKRVFQCLRGRERGRRREGGAVGE